MAQKHDDFMQKLRTWAKLPNQIELEKCSTMELEKLLEIMETGRNLTSSDSHLINKIVAEQKQRFPIGQRGRFTTALNPVLNSAESKTNNNPLSNTNKTIMTRSDKILVIKNSNEFDIIKTIDLHTCSDEDLNKLNTIVSNEKKGIGRSATDWRVVNEIKKKQIKPVGKFS